MTTKGEAKKPPAKTAGKKLSWTKLLHSPWLWVGLGVGLLAVWYLYSKGSGGSTSAAGGTSAGGLQLTYPASSQGSIPASGTSGTVRHRTSNATLTQSEIAALQAEIQGTQSALVGLANAYQPAKATATQTGPVTVSGSSVTGVAANGTGNQTPSVTKPAAASQTAANLTPATSDPYTNGQYAAMVQQRAVTQLQNAIGKTVAASSPAKAVSTSSTTRPAPTTAAVIQQRAVTQQQNAIGRTTAAISTPSAPGVGQTQSTSYAQQVQARQAAGLPIWINHKAYSSYAAYHASQAARQPSGRSAGGSTSRTPVQQLHAMQYAGRVG